MAILYIISNTFPADMYPEVSKIMVSTFWQHTRKISDYLISPTLVTLNLCDTEKQLLSYSYSHISTIVKIRYTMDTAEIDVKSNIVTQLAS